MIGTVSPVQQQSALYKDYAAFQAVFPEVKQALQVAMAQLVKNRPADPLAFLAQRLREANEEGKLERAAADKERREQELAAVRIQALNRGKQGKARTAQIKANNGIFVRELFKKLSSDNESGSEKIVNATALHMFCKGGEDRAALNLPARLSQHVPPKINATCKKIAKSMIEWPTTDKDLGFYEFASLFGFSEGEADEAEQAAAAVRIQAMSRKKQGAAVAVERKRRVLESTDASAYTARL